MWSTSYIEGTSTATVMVPLRSNFHKIQFLVAYVTRFNLPDKEVILYYTFLSYDIPFTGKHELNKLTCSQLCDFVAQLVRALHRHRRGHCSNPVESPEFFRFMRQ